MCGGNAAQSIDEGHAKSLRIVAIITVVLGIVQLGVDLAVYTALDNVKLGAFWAAAVIIVAAGFCIFSSSRSMVIAGCVFSVIAVIVGLIGAIVDGIASSVISALETCVDQNGKVSGADTSPTDDLFGFQTCQPGQYGTFYGTFYDFDCGCYTKSSISCLYYSGPMIADDCNNMLTTYTTNLTAACAFDAIGLIMVFILSVFTCVAVCGGTKATSVQPAMPGQVQMVAVPANPQYVPVQQQQQMAYQGVPQQQVVYASAPQQQQQMVYGGVPQQAQMFQPQQQQMVMGPNGQMMPFQPQQPVMVQKF